MLRTPYPCKFLAVAESDDTWTDNDRHTMPAERPGGAVSKEVE